MFPSWYYILFIIIFDSVNVHSHETTDKTPDVTKKNVSGVAPGNGGKLLLNAKRKAVDFDEIRDRALYGDGSGYISEKGSQDESLSSLEGGEEYSDDDYNDDSSEGVTKTRALQAGDVMTPVDMLPVASKLLKKALGEGRGIVSSSKSPEDLADKLFGAYFMTTRRIVYVTEQDLSGLDALQALALEGEAVKMRSSGNSITEKPAETFNVLVHGQWVEQDPHPVRCHYKLLFKNVSPRHTVLRKGKSGGITPFNKISKLEKKMSRNRHLIINRKTRKSNKENNNSKTGVRAENKEASEDEVKKDGEHKKHKLSKAGKNKVEKLKSKQKLKYRPHKMARKKKLNKHRKQQKKKRKPKFTEKLKHLRNTNIDLNMPITTTQRPVCKWQYICRISSDLDTCRLHTSCIDGLYNKPMLDKKYVDAAVRKNKEVQGLVVHFRKMLARKKLNKHRKQQKKNRKPKFTEKLKHLRNTNIDLNMPITTTQRPVCKWRYICRIPNDLDTCRLHTSCIDGINNKPMLDKKYVDAAVRKNKEVEELVVHFRKMLGLTALDEEVEKIMERHVLLVKPENMNPDTKIETLTEYFNNIVMAQHASTTPGVVVGFSESNESNTRHPLGGIVTDTTPMDWLSSREDLRQIGGEKVKMKSTPTSILRDPFSVSTMITTPKYSVN